jgi:murein L,D-transpeptidase YcbB/YkuD
MAEDQVEEKDTAAIVEAIKLLQRLLGVPADGIWGKHSSMALHEWQERYLPGVWLK